MGKPTPHEVTLAKLKSGQATPLCLAPLAALSRAIDRATAPKRPAGVAPRRPPPRR